MAKNIVIFSDGTGQRGGLLFDENRSNIYKLFRACRCSPDSSVEPSTQLAFYDPGLGTLPLGSDFFGTAWRRVYNIVSQALGLGLTGNIIDCYAAIIRMWDPGDHIYLFGFSRGAYTVRCLAGVLKYCGIPTRVGGGPLRRDEAGSKNIARIAVKRVYQFTESRPLNERTQEQDDLLRTRDRLANEFRTKYRSENAEPYFIGVFDTVASLSNPAALVLFGLVGLVFLVVVSAIATHWDFSFWWTLLILLVGTAIVSWAANFISRLRFPSLSGWKGRPHLTEPRMKFYDTGLSPNVRFAYHAISIDECRSSFERVEWGSRGAASDLEQICFAGDHADVGGGHLENESRLSDIALLWILDKAKDAGLRCDGSVLHLHQDAAALQHDETRSDWKFRLASHLMGDKPRRPDESAPLHPTVLERFAVADGVVQFDVARPYRPPCLRNNVSVRHFFDADDLIQ
jgi:uncharacterized protein (DUF2235 family)